MADQRFISDIRANTEIAHGYFLLTLELPKYVRNPKPGEFFMVSVGRGTDPLLRRPLSLHRLISDDTFQVLYKIVGKGTMILSKKKVGEKLDILGPLGKGFETPSSMEDAILIAGGIGIAPLYALSEELRKIGKSVKLFMGGRSRKDILLEKELGSLGIKTIISTEDASYGKKGLITDIFEDYLKTQDSRLKTQVYACGPREMLKRVSELAETQDIPCYVSLEERMACGVGACLGCAVKIRVQSQESRVQRKKSSLTKPRTPNSELYRMVCKEGPVFNAKDIDWGSM